DATALLLGLSALGLRSALDDLRPALPLGEGQAQHPRRHRGAPVQTAAAQREAERKPQAVRQPRRRSLKPQTSARHRPPPGAIREAVLFCPAPTPLPSPPASPPPSR